jgi:hypothetical protein
MRVSKSILPLALALCVAACSSDVEGAAQAAEASQPSPTDQLALRSIQLLDACTEVVVEATEQGSVESAATTLKSLSIELGELREELYASKLSLENHPTYAAQWNDAELRLRNAISLMTTNNPKAAETLTGVLKGLNLSD